METEEIFQDAGCGDFSEVFMKLINRSLQGFRKSSFNSSEHFGTLDL